MSPGPEPPSQLLASLLETDVLLGLALSLVFGLVWLRHHRPALALWALTWATLPLALSASRADRGEGTGARLASFLAVAGVLHGLLLVTAAWHEARGGRSWRVWLVAVAAVGAGALALGALSPSERARDALVVFPAVSSLAGGILLMAADARGGFGRRLAASGLVALGLTHLMLSSLRSASLETLVSPRVAIVAEPLGLVGLLVAGLALLVARAEDAERALAGAHSSLDGLRRSLAASAAADPLTGFFSRRAFRELVDHVRDGSTTSRGCVLVLDMDGLKRINDTQGHSMGDKAIFRMARVTEAALRSGDLPIRWGGDEFVVVLPGAGLREAEALRNGIQTSLLKEGISVSGGLSVYGPDLDIVLALREADRLMYVAKRQRREAREAATVQLRLPLDERAASTPPGS
jgi:diguanylate cyclase (GGDEF)-like protein